MRAAITYLLKDHGHTLAWVALIAALVVALSLFRLS